MKRSPKCTPLINETHHFCGVSLDQLGAAEHEHGLTFIQKSFGIHSDLTQEIYRRDRISICPPKLILVESPSDNLLFFAQYGASGFRKKVRDKPVIKSSVFPEQLTCYYPSPLAGAWSDCDFGIYGVGAGMEHIRALYAAFKARDVSILIAGDNFRRCARKLCIMITSRTPRAFWPASAPMSSATATR